MAPKPTPKPAGQVEVLRPFVRGRAATNAFFDSLATASDLPVADLKRVFESIRKVAVRELRSTGTFTLHTIGTFQVKTSPGTSEQCDGKPSTRRERPSKKYVSCNVAAQLSDLVVN